MDFNGNFKSEQNELRTSPCQVMRFVTVFLMGFQLVS